MFTCFVTLGNFIKQGRELIEALRTKDVYRQSFANLGSEMRKSLSLAMWPWWWMWPVKGPGCLEVIVVRKDKETWRYARDIYPYQGGYRLLRNAMNKWTFLLMLS